MSWKIVRDVWDHAQVSSSELLVLLTIAEHCQDCRHGWVSFTRLAERTRLVERTVKRLVHGLERSGHLVISPFKAKNKANVYTLLCRWHKITEHMGTCDNCNRKGVILNHQDPLIDPLYISQKSQNGKVPKEEWDKRRVAQWQAELFDLRNGLDKWTLGSDPWQASMDKITKLEVLLQEFKGS